MRSLDEAWLDALDEIEACGERVSPRGLDTLELLDHQLRVDMSRCVLTVKARALGYRFMAAEAAWMLSGDDRVETIAPYSKVISNFSDDGVRFFGAYGPKLRTQLGHVVAALDTDPLTRQAVANIWRENPMKTKDYPCHLSCQFTIRNGRLDCHVAMRSSDAWLGVPYDVFNFSMWSGYVLLHLADESVKLGALCNTAASRHLYGRNMPEVAVCLVEPEPAFAYAPFNPREFAKPEELVEHLWKVARRERVSYAWLKELS